MHNSGSLKARPRLDGLGDGWAKEHRQALGNKFYLQDFDGISGSFGFAQNTQDKLFAEYVPDDYRNRHSMIRRFAYIAFFDRKKTYDALHHHSSNLCLACYLDMCRKLAVTQPIPPKFFYIIGGEKPPWDIRNVNIYTGAMDEDYCALQKASWKAIWSIFGLDKMRQELEGWLSHWEEPTP